MIDMSLGTKYDFFLIIHSKVAKRFQIDSY